MIRSVNIIIYNEHIYKITHYAVIKKYLLFKTQLCKYSLFKQK